MDLASIVDSETMARIVKNKKLVLHSVGDTGGVNTPTYIEGVTRYMECDFTYAPDPSSVPALLYHLGDVVYYDGESANYWPEFYEPYLNYHAPSLPFLAIMMAMSTRIPARPACRHSFETCVRNRPR